METETEEGGRERRDDHERERKKRSARFYFYRFPESCLGLNGGKEAKKNGAERHTRANYFITLAPSGLL